ncbi:MAG: tRNA (guanine-N(1)-)-methyltransferase [Candidatus Pacebacteria bacterium GW2011_GWF2_38_9]|nr:MAG: tRNA (guanine-N(1)-)-methyltransferase, tRNA (guanine37-N1)-methyltransferase [candidate division TM6 bacterium GW2011_GWF2_28_16]KKQ10221.1 MAG: tRNA (guanine-N(1)-)-methyltransferase [Candidatus Pacebacteria bacterium GW2011_GWF1_36_5]KKQ88819.1 MAG: tRNA (guanine-N(1)-)-methyltransferase [Candidatus Pacebacteria bacterium GW2011_GWF2_38_9]HAZ73241.1 tRNA (guanosine(37)-N1)-methyltransferase TrmD [Candidatus Paceibacterota bacterium]
MKINILTIFPDFFKTPLETSILKRALAKEAIEFKIINLRDFAEGKHQTTDQRPFGGGPGMVMMIEPIDKALQSLGLSKGQKNKRILLTSAKGNLFTQEVARDFSSLDELTLICGHYEGVDERVALYLIDAEIRIGDYVLTGGETASLVIADAVTRLIPGVLGNELSNQDESHSQPGKMAHPQFTKPVEYKGWNVPEVLLSGNHQKIKDWRTH